MLSLCRFLKSKWSNRNKTDCKTDRKKKSSSSSPSRSSCWKTQRSDESNQQL